MDKNPWFAWIDRDYWFEKEKKRMLAWGYTPEQIEQHIKEILEKEEAIKQEEKQRQQEIAEMYEKLPPAVKDVLAYEAEKYEKSLSDMKERIEELEEKISDLEDEIEDLKEEK